MQTVLDAIAQHKRTVSAHPFYVWLTRVATPAEAFRFAPLFVNFIMAFSDINKWLMRYRVPNGDLERIINEHTREDQTHSRLFLEDWHKLELDRALGWRASDMIWWYFAAAPTERFRAFGMELMQMVAQNTDAGVRFSVMEAIEVCGHVFFTYTAQVARVLEAETGLQYRYFGDYHLARETGHLHGDEGAFTELALSEAQRERALRLVARVFEMFLVENDMLLDYANSSAAVRCDSRRPIAWCQRALPRPTPVFDRQRPAPQPPPASCSRVRATLSRRLASTERHALFGWLRQASPLRATDLLRRLVPLWVPDIMGYRDLNRYALPCPNRGDPEARAINRWIARLSSHASLFIHDWQRLGLDDWLGWSAGRTLRFYTLDAQTELARKNFMSFIRLGFTIDDPRVRFWFISALEATGLPFFRETKRLALAAEETVGALDYLADRHQLAHPEEEMDAEADAVDFECTPLAAASEELAHNLIEHVFDCIEAQYTETLERLQAQEERQEAHS